MAWDKNRVAALPQVVHPTDLRSLIDSLPDPLIVADGRGLIRFANGPAGQLFSQAASEMIGTALPVSPDDQRYSAEKPGSIDLDLFNLRWVQLMWEGNLAWCAFFVPAIGGGGVGGDAELERRAVQAELRCEQFHEQLKKTQEQNAAMVERGKALTRQLQQRESDIQEMKTQTEFLQHRCQQAETKAKETEDAALEGWTGAEDRAREAESQRDELEMRINALERQLSETQARELHLNQELDLLRSAQPEDWQRQTRHAEEQLSAQLQRISLMEKELEKLRERAAAKEGQASNDETRAALEEKEKQASEAKHRVVQLERRLYDQEQHTLEAEKRAETYAFRLSEVQSQAREQEQGLQERLTALTARDRETKRLAFEDPLTGLANYNILLQYLEYTVGLVQRAEGAAILIVVDLDRIRSINSTISHAAGDQILIQFAERLRSYARNTDVLARRRADEFVFVVALQSTEPEAKSTVAQMAQALAQKIVTGLEEPFVVEGTSVLMTCGIGLTMFGTPGETSDQVVEQAYTALEKSKELGRNRFYFFGPDLQDRSRRRHLLIPRLKDALERQEFVLQYQPVVDLKTGKVVGLESLLRWHDPNVGVLEPKDFLSLAEESGLIMPIGEWAIQEACLMASQYRDLFVSINLSLRQILQSDFPRRFMKAVERARVRPEKIIVEVSESTSAFDPDRVAACLSELARWKVGMAIDDFGTSSTALNRLHQEHLKILKIDGSLIQQIPEDAGSSRLVLGTCALAQSLKLQALAEGVETTEQLSFLRKVGCHLAQGRALVPPVGASQLKDAVRKTWKFN